MDRKKLLALTNTSIGIFMAFANYNMIIIALPAIFKGLSFNPTSPDSLGYLIWVILGYMVVTASLVVTFGRISDLKGRARLYTIGFLIFAIASALLASITSTGNLGVMEMIIFRLLQGVGGGLLMVNSTAVLTDYFDRRELGKALGLNQVAGLVGGVAGLIIGGILSIYNWRYIFIFSAVVGIIGTIWSALTLKDIQKPIKRSIDVIGNTLFALGITILLISVTYGLLPYNNQPLGWSNPWVIAGILVSVGVISSFVFIERKVKDPMFDLSLFKNRDFSTSNTANMIASLARQGILLMLLVLLQGIWLPLHGVPYCDTPFWAGIYLIPNVLGFAVFGPISGILSDRYGGKMLTSLGLTISGIGFLLLTLLPYNFNLYEFFAITFIQGAGMGLFTAPNTADMMASVPINKRGAASGMRAALQNTASAFSVVFYFSILISAMTGSLDSSISSALSSYGIHVNASIPASVVIFSALLGYDPLSAFSSSLPHSIAVKIDNPQFFVATIAPSFMSSLRLTLYISAGLLFMSALISAFRESGRVGRLGNNTQGKQETERAIAKGS
ncbi:MFS transporter [Acidianus ambivalens]|uniref:MFS transporter n=1 Tax=Acidianus ambivalens TaxID=2283 RepID=A0A650CSX9_ACIAM|nr:MFS transporter [Acidianus ambivalens]MQL55027.1 MFS transporter [Acidianus ambivalens]QGR20587.1 MFS transporter [Acidianus ambivalens]